MRTLDKIRQPLMNIRDNGFRKYFLLIMIENETMLNPSFEIKT